MINCASPTITIATRDRYTFVGTYSGRGLRRSFIFYALLKSVQGFRGHERLKFALYHYFGCWLLQHLVLPYKPPCKANKLEQVTNWRCERGIILVSWVFGSFFINLTCITLQHTFQAKLILRIECTIIIIIMHYTVHSLKLSSTYTN